MDAVLLMNDESNTVTEEKVSAKIAPPTCARVCACAYSLVNACVHGVRARALPICSAALARVLYLSRVIVENAIRERRMGGNDEHSRSASSRSAAHHR